MLYGPMPLCWACERNDCFMSTIRTPLVRTIHPSPVCVDVTGGLFTFGADLSLCLSPAFVPQELDAVRSLWDAFTAQCCPLQVQSDPAYASYQAWFGPAAPSCSCPALTEGNEYLVQVTEQGIWLLARDYPGFCHGLTTLLQLIQPRSLREGAVQFAAPCVLMEDRPATGFRSIHLCIFPESKLSLIEKAIRMAGLMKYTHVVLEFWGVLQYDALPELAWPGKSYTKDQIKPLIHAAHAYGMEVIPMLNHLGHATQSRACYGRHVVLNQNPRLACLFEPDGWTWCISNPDTLSLLRALRKELMELCGPGSYFHLGCDEAYSYATCDCCSQKDGPKLLADYLNGLTEELAAEGRRPIIWGDALLDATVWKSPNIATSRPDQRTHEALELLDRRIVIADWQYSITQPSCPTAAYFMEKGFDTLLCPWDNYENMSSLTAAAQELHAMGVMATTWDHLPEFIPRIPFIGGAMWMSKDNRDDEGLNHTITASWLRKVFPGEDYSQYGWHRWEVAE